MTTTRELAYKLWQIRSIYGRHTTSECDWYDAEKILKNEDGYEQIKNELDLDLNDLKQDQQ